MFPVSGRGDRSCGSRKGRTWANRSRKRVTVPISGSPMERIIVFFQCRLPSLTLLILSQGMSSGLSREEKGILTSRKSPGEVIPTVAHLL